jgi:hypothetical protein
MGLMAARRWRKQVRPEERALSRTDANRFIADFVAGLEGYTYLEGDVPA